MNETDQKNNHKLPNSDEYDYLLEDGEEELSEDAQAMVDVLEADEEFNKEIQALISSLDQDNLDLALIQSKFLLLIKAALIRLGNGKSRAIEHKLKMKEKDILEQLTMLSHHLMMMKTPMAKEMSKGIDAPKDKNDYLTAASVRNTKQILKRFAIYEIYKVLNPRRIAGETKRENFIHNYISGGIRKAMHYDLSEHKSMRREVVKQVDRVAAPKLIKGRGI